MLYVRMYIPWKDIILGYNCCDETPCIDCQWITNDPKKNKQTHNSLVIACTYAQDICYETSTVEPNPVTYGTKLSDCIRGYTGL